MDLEELLTLLELDEPSGFEYFENLADLVECETEIPEETLYMLFSEVNASAVAEIIEHYFEEMLETMPDDSIEIYTLLENIKLALLGLLGAGEEDSARLHFAEEFHKFRTWYTFESEVICSNIDSGEEKTLPLRDALTLSRLEKLEHDEYRYDFAGCLEYELEEYIMDFADLAKEELTYESDDLLENGYLYDDEMKGQ
ncbi:MAG: hypothetical protein RR626_06670 [Anaerovoracaceae bacterium]